MTGQAGAFFRVVTPGEMHVGDTLVLSRRVHPTWYVGSRDDAVGVVRMLWRRDDAVCGGGLYV